MKQIIKFFFFLGACSGVSRGALIEKQLDKKNNPEDTDNSFINWTKNLQLNPGEAGQKTLKDIFAQEATVPLILVKGSLPDSLPNENTLSQLDNLKKEYQNSYAEWISDLQEIASATTDRAVDIASLVKRKHKLERHLKELSRRMKALNAMPESIAENCLSDSDDSEGEAYGKPGHAKTLLDRRTETKKLLEEKKKYYENQNRTTEEHLTEQKATYAELTKQYNQLEETLKTIKNTITEKSAEDILTKNTLAEIAEKIEQQELLRPYAKQRYIYLKDQITDELKQLNEEIRNDKLPQAEIVTLVSRKNTLNQQLKEVQTNADKIDFNIHTSGTYLGGMYRKVSDLLFE